MAIMGFNAGAEMAQLRSQQTLAMQAAAPAAAPATPSAAAVAPTVAATAAAAPVAAAAGSAGAVDASAAAAAVQEPPATSKIVLQSVLKGAMSGAGMTLGLKSMAPMFMKMGFMGAWPAAATATSAAVKASGVLGFISKVPILKSVLPAIGKMGGIQGLLITAGIGAAVGGIFGAISGMKKAKAATAAYAEAQAAQQAAAEQAAQQEAAQQPAAEPAPTPAQTQRRFKSWVIAKSGDTKTSGGSFAHYTVRRGDTVEVLAKRFHTTPAEIKKLNPNMGELAPGVEVKLRRKVVPNATAWKG